MKTCIRCRIEKPLDQFNKDKQKPDGFYNYCRICVKEKRHKNNNKCELCRGAIMDISQYCNQCQGRIKGDDKHAHWKGDNAGMAAMHNWVIRKKGMAGKHKCKCGKPAQHWSNKDHSYKRKLNDYVAMCAYCHTNYDRKFNNKKFRSPKRGERGRFVA